VWERCWSGVKGRRVGACGVWRCSTGARALGRRGERRRVDEDARRAVAAPEIGGAGVEEALAIGHGEAWWRVVGEVTKASALRRGVTASALPEVAA
jgi:hypothetical protein